MQHDITNHNVTVLNLEEALARVDGDHQLLGELAALFLDEYPHMLAAIRAALARRDAKALQHAAHTLKGSVGNFGATAVFEAAFALEQMGRHGDFSGADAVCSRLEAELARLQPALATLATAEVA
ncbi:MAG: Hpt domain-containing protein [Thermodesulfobacteriota bacterium]|jgi:HPt (histidine-containing phosphotransfer) domain-containing protein